MNARRLKRAKAMVFALGGLFMVALFSFALPVLPLLGPGMTVAHAAVYMQPRQRRVLSKVNFAQLPGWQADDHQAAFDAFQRSCVEIRRILRGAHGGRRRASKYRAFRRACGNSARAGQTLSAIHARKFFEQNFVPYRVRRTRTERLLTGYYEPLIQGSRVRTEKFNIPIYRVPDDLLVFASRRTRLRARRAGIRAPLMAARQTKKGLKPYYTRAGIENGALKGKGLEILYLSDMIDAFFLHIQGSGRIILPDGSSVRLAFAAKNGQPYSSIGKYMIRKGILRREDATLENMKAWLRADLERARKLLWHNKSFIFFRELQGHSGGPIGAQSVPLTPLRSIAIDKRYHYLGTPIYVDVPGLRDSEQKPFRRLLIAQDVGSAIKGPERGDIYWGTGDRAGELAGLTGHRGKFYILLPKY